MMTKETYDATEQIARAEHAAAKGKLYRVSQLSGYCTESDMDVFDCDAVVRVLPTPDADIRHWNGDWLDPYWDCKVVRYLTPPSKPLRSVWMDGPSHCPHTGERTWSAKPLTGWQAIKLRLTGKL